MFPPGVAFISVHAVSCRAIFGQKIFEKREKKSFVTTKLREQYFISLSTDNDAGFSRSMLNFFRLEVKCKNSARNYSLTRSVRYNALACDVILTAMTRRAVLLLVLTSFYLDLSPTTPAFVTIGDDLQHRISEYLFIILRIYRVWNEKKKKKIEWSNYYCTPSGRTGKMSRKWRYTVIWVQTVR